MSDESNATKAIPGGVEINFHGQPQKLKYNLYSFCKLDEATGKNPLDGSVWVAARPKDLVALVWAGMQHLDPAPTQEDVAKGIDLQDISKLPAILKDAFGQVTPPEEEKKSSPEAITPASEQS